MFLSNTDYQVMIGERAFDLIQQSDEDNLRHAEEMAQEEMAGYLRPRYDVGRIFARRGTERNMQIVMFLCDITLYHLVSWLPQKMGYEIREIRYRRAIEWLQGVQSGKNPCLPAGEALRPPGQRQRHFAGWPRPAAPPFLPLMQEKGQKKIKATGCRAESRRRGR